MVVNIEHGVEKHKRPDSLLEETWLHPQAREALMERANMTAEQFTRNMFDNNKINADFSADSDSDNQDEKETEDLK